jgi:hypothetical protein
MKEFWSELFLVMMGIVIIYSLMSAMVVQPDTLEEKKEHVESR